MATGGVRQDYPDFTGATGPYFNIERKKYYFSRHLEILDQEIINIQSEIDHMGNTGNTGATGLSERINNGIDQLNFLNSKKTRINDMISSFDEVIDNKMTIDEINEINDINSLFNNQYKNQIDQLPLMHHIRRNKFLYIYRNSPTTKDKESSIRCFFNLI